MSEPQHIVSFIPAWVRCTFYDDSLCSNHNDCRAAADAVADDQFPKGYAE